MLFSPVRSVASQTGSWRLQLYCAATMLPLCTCAMPKIVPLMAPDPNAPKRGLSAYMFFANEQRENVREENPGITFGQVGKLLGERWKALNDKQRAPYEAKAAADKKRYEDEKQAYNVGTPLYPEARLTRVN